MNYDVNHFINKFEAIPESKWTVGQLFKPDGSACAYGHCGGYDTEEACSLRILTLGVSKRILGHSLSIAHINDGCLWFGKDQRIIDSGSTPKERVINFLKQVKQLQEQDRAVEEVNNIISSPQILEYV